MQLNYKMELDIVSEVENSLFNRKEIEATIENNVAPSREDVANLLASKYSCDANAIKIRTIMGKFGSRVFIINANIYKSKEEKDNIEHKTKRDQELEKKLNTPKEEVKEESQDQTQEDANSEQPVQEITKENSESSEENKEAQE